MFFGFKLENRARFYRTTGMRREEFDVLLPKFVAMCNEDHKLEKLARGKHVTGPKFNYENMFFFCLFFLRVYPTCFLAGRIFDVDDAQISRWSNKFLPKLERLLGRENVLPKRKVSSYQEMYELIGEDIFPDGTERPVYRKKDYEKQKSEYSGKKKFIHTKPSLS